MNSHLLVIRAPFAHSQTEGQERETKARAAPRLVGFQHTAMGQNLTTLTHSDTAASSV